MKPRSNSGLGLRKGAWTADEDIILKNYIEKYGEGKWHIVPLKAALNRCRKSCRLRWLNYLRPNIKRGTFGEDEVDLILRLHKLLGNRWSLIAGRIPGRTANDVKNYWNTQIRLRSKPQKKEVGHDESLQDNRIKIIKPQPRSYSKNLNNNLNMCSGLISTSDVLDHETINECLDGLFDDHEKEIDGNFGWYSFDSSSADKKVLNGVEHEVDYSSLFDFPVDELTWDFINSDKLGF
ncbi:unnamed protein product [Lactuca saligna]|uniref:Uncharacterized protein n=1 Tax=Lactuca saligna TaxID=75948 RepID=A0AA35VPU3_LACSI|nr:unnamed protein product [Lactuca saligna]